MAIDKAVLELMSEEEREEYDIQQKERAVFISDMRDLMKDSRCRKLVFFVLDSTNLNGVQYTGDNNETNFNLGKAAVGYSLLELLGEIDPTLYPTLLLNKAKESMR